MKNALINTALVLGSIIFTLSIFEIALRFTKYNDLVPPIYSYPQHYFESDPEIGIDLVRNAPPAMHRLRDYLYEVYTNRYRCFDYDRGVPDEYGLILGDSYTWGYSPLDKKWTKLLEDKSGLFMLKCGVSGTGTKHQFFKAKRVIKEVMKNPKVILVLYTGNDLNDDHAFPSMSTMDGYLIGRLKHTDLVTGKKTLYTEKEAIKRYRKKLGNSSLLTPWQRFLNYWKKLRYKSVVYKTYRRVITPRLREIGKNISDYVSGNKTVSIRGKTSDYVSDNNTMPDNMRGRYGLSLIAFANQKDLPWFNKLIEEHKKTIRSFALYANSINAKFLFIDMGGYLTQEIFSDLQEFFSNTQNAYYYDLTDDFPLAISGKRYQWLNDSHWNIDGNRKAAECIYQHFQKELNSL